MNKMLCALIAFSSISIRSTICLGIDAPYCGLYSVFAGVQSLGIDADFSKALDSKFVSRESGSTATQLIALADAFGAAGKYQSQMNISTLRAAQNPIVLHTSVAVASTGFHHWVLYLGMDGDSIRLYEPPTGMSTVTQAELLSFWDGKGIEIKRRHQASDPTNILTKTPLYSAELALACVLVIATSVVLTKVMYLAGRPAMRVCLVAFVSSAVWHSVVNYGFFSNQIAFSNITSNFEDFTFKSVSDKQFRDAVGNSDCTIVDARLAMDYERYHVPGALNIPINIDYGNLRRALAKIPPGNRVIVYCRSIDCTWADAVAKKLPSRGFANVTVYPEGMVGWKSRKFEEENSENATPEDE